VKSESAVPFWTRTEENAILGQCPSSIISAELLIFHPEEISSIPLVQNSGGYRGSACVVTGSPYTNKNELEMPLRRKEGEEDKKQRR
jgi:hypothetical protein